VSEAKATKDGRGWQKQMKQTRCSGDSKESISELEVEENNLLDNFIDTKPSGSVSKQLRKKQAVAAWVGENLRGREM